MDFINWERKGNFNKHIDNIITNYCSVSISEISSTIGGTTGTSLITDFN